MLDYRRLPDALPRDTRMLSPPPVLFCTSEVIFGIVGFNTRCFVFEKRCAGFFVIRILPKAPLTA